MEVFNSSVRSFVLGHTVGAEPEAVARLRWTRRMATFQDVNARLNELVPNGGDARAMDQTAVFASLADAQLCLRRTDPEVVRAAQRTLEDVLLRITCGGWAGPAVRRSASDVLSTLFSVGASRRHDAPLPSPPHERVGITNEPSIDRKPVLTSHPSLSND